MRKPSNMNKTTMVPGPVPILPSSPSILPSSLFAPFPPNPQLNPRPLSLAPLSVQLLLQTKRELQTQITNLKDVLGLQKELQDLSLETQSLQRALMGNLQGPIPKTPQTGCKGPSQKQGNKKLTFPVLTRAQAHQAAPGHKDSALGPPINIRGNQRVMMRRINKL